MYCSKGVSDLETLWIILRLQEKLWKFEFSHPFVLNDTLMRKILQPLKKPLG